MCQGLYSCVLRAKSVYDSPAFWMGFTHDDHIRAEKTNKKNFLFLLVMWLKVHLYPPSHHLPGARFPIVTIVI
jgi:hypothetical protein